MFSYKIVYYYLNPFKLFLFCYLVATLYNTFDKEIAACFMKHFFKANIDKISRRMATCIRQHRCYCILLLISGVRITVLTKTKMCQIKVNEQKRLSIGQNSLFYI